MDKQTQSQLITEIIRLQRRVCDLDDEVAMLRAQNDYLQEVLTNSGVGVDSHERDTVPATPSTEHPTRPSSPRAIRLEELHAALEASDAAREEVNSVRWDRCPICQRTDEHEHDIDSDLE